MRGGLGRTEAPLLLSFTGIGALVPQFEVSPVVLEKLVRILFERGSIRPYSKAEFLMSRRRHRRPAHGSIRSESSPHVTKGENLTCGQVACIFSTLVVIDGKDLRRQTICERTLDRLSFGTQRS